MEEFSEEKVKQESILELTRKISVLADESLSKNFPIIQAAIIEIISKDGVFEERVDFPKGEPENPLSDTEFRERYDELMRYAKVNKSVSDTIYDTVYENNIPVNKLLEDNI